MKFRIGPKLAATIIALLFACIGVMVFRTLGNTDAKSRAAKTQYESAVAAERFVSDLTQLNLHGGDSEIERKRASALRADAIRQLEKLKKNAASSRETELLTVLEGQAGAGPHGATKKVTDTEVQARLVAIDSAAEEYRKYSQERLTALNSAEAQDTSQAQTSLSTLSATFAIVGFLLVLMAARCATEAYTDLVVIMQKVAGGDLMQKLDPSYLTRNDQTGNLARGLQSIISTFSAALNEITDGIGTLSSAAAKLSKDSSVVLNGARGASERAHAVASASEEMNASAIAVASGMEQASNNLSIVATSTEQMTATISEIACNSERARRVAEEAAQQAGHINAEMGQLGTAVNEIGKVTETINEIAAQTNLLALNATIEAARAGASGKGFAVVANEIKELAQQTAAATGDIKSRIDGVQSSATNGIDGIGRISHIIGEVTGAVTSIATAIEEQSVMAKEITTNILEASQGVQEANRQMSQTTQATSAIASDVAAVDNLAGDLTGGSADVGASANELSKVAERLQSAVLQFRVAGQHRMMVNNAIAAHGAWTARLRTAIDTGKLDIPINAIRADNQCQFGKWLHNEHCWDEHSRTETYAKMTTLHAKFHEEAARVAQLATSQQKQAAEQALSAGGEYARLSSTLTAELTHWADSV